MSTASSSVVRRMSSVIASTLALPVRQLPVAAVDIAPWLGLAAGLGSAGVALVRRRRRGSSSDGMADARLRAEIDAMRGVARVG